MRQRPPPSIASACYSSTLRAVATVAILLLASAFDAPEAVFDGNFEPKRSRWVVLSRFHVT